MGRSEEEEAVGVLAKAVAEHAEAIGSVAETAGDLGGGPLLDEKGRKMRARSVSSFASLEDIHPLYQTFLDCQGGTQKNTTKASKNARNLEIFPVWRGKPGLRTNH
jgi:hypothetical protein